jgi:methylase of polypeptide subunit release factors
MNDAEYRLGTRSRLHLASQDERYTLAAAGLPPAVDCGWVEQMLPFIDAYSRRGDVVLDPFCGWGTTLLATGLMHRRGIGIEIEESRVDVARRRLAFHSLTDVAQVLHDDSTSMPLDAECVDLSLTSIPYFSARRDPVRSHEATFTSQCYAQNDYAAYLEILDRVFAEVTRVLKPGAYFVAMAENLRVEDKFVPLAWDCARLLMRHLELGDERILTYDTYGGGVAGLRTNRSHEYALVCRKS